MWSTICLCRICFLREGGMGAFCLTVTCFTLQTGCGVLRQNEICYGILL